MIKRLWEIREQVRQTKPLVYNITNNVVTNFTANVLLAAGASPIMSEGAAEAEALVNLSDVLVLNIGTLHTRQINYCLKAGEYANKAGKPIVFDPVGVGATPYRNYTAAQILTDIKVTAIRGNYGEISYLAGAGNDVKGVDNVTEGINTAMIKDLARSSGAVVTATGPVDYIIDGDKVLTNSSGHIMLQLVTGTGCALSSLTGAFLSVVEDRALSALAAISFYGAAAEKAVKSSKGPGSFSLKFIDALYNLEYKEYKKYVEGKIEDEQVGAESSAATEVADDGADTDEAWES